MTRAFRPHTPAARTARHQSGQVCSRIEPANAVEPASAIHHVRTKYPTARRRTCRLGAMALPAAWDVIIPRHRAVAVPSDLVLVTYDGTSGGSSGTNCSSIHLFNPPAAGWGGQGIGRCEP